MTHDTGRTVLRNFLWNSIGMGILMLAQWLMSIFVVRLAGYESAGVFSLAMTTSATFGSISGYGMRNFQVSDIDGAYSDQVYIRTRLLTCLASLAICAAFAYLNAYDATQRACILFYMTVRASEGLSDVFHGIDQRADRMDYIGASAGAKGILELAAFYIVLLRTGDITLALLAIAGVSILFSVAVDWPLSRRFMKKDGEKPTGTIKGLLIQCFPLFAMAFLSSVIPMMPKYYLERLYGSELLGKYSTVALPAVVVQVAASFLFTPFVSHLARAYGAGDEKGFRGLHRTCLLLIGVLTALLMAVAAFLGEPLLALIFGEEILPYAYLLPSVMLCTGLTAYLWYFSAVLAVIRALWSQLIAMAIGFAFSAAVSYPAVLLYSVDGINPSWGIALLLSIVYMAVVYTKRTKCHFAKTHAQ